MMDHRRGRTKRRSTRLQKNMLDDTEIQLADDGAQKRLLLRTVHFYL
jgi:hypothetical protein